MRGDGAAKEEGGAGKDGGGGPQKEEGRRGGDRDGGRDRWWHVAEFEFESELTAI